MGFDRKKCIAFVDEEEGRNPCHAGLVQGVFKRGDTVEVKDQNDRCSSGRR